MADVASTTNLIREMVNALQNCAPDNSTPLLNLATREQGSSDKYTWLLKYADNESTTSFTENAAVSAAGAVAYAKPYLAFSGGFRRTMIRVTGHAADYTRGGYEDVLSREVESAYARHQKKIEQAGCAALEGQIDNSGSIFGLTRSATNTASYEASIGTPSKADLTTMWNTLASGTIGMDMSRVLLLSQIGVMQTYADTFTPGSNTPLNYTPGTAIEGSNTAGGILFNQRPWVIVPDMTSTVLLLIDPKYLKRVVLRDLTLKEMGPQDDSDTWALTSSEILVYENPRFAGKLTDI